MSRVIVEQSNDPQLAAEMRVQERKLRRNLAVFDVHAPRLFRESRGKAVAVAGGELHVADTPDAAWAWARSAHPDDEGVFVHYIPRAKGWRVYADHRGMAPV